MVAYANKNINRVLRWMKFSREKRRKLMARYDNLILRALQKFGPGKQISHTEELANRKLQIAINRQNKEFEEKHE